MGTATSAVERLAAAKRLDPAQLREWGCEDNGPNVSISYRADDGQEMFRRLRYPEGDGRRFGQPKGVALQPYGLERLEAARKVGVLWICEGESDTWAMWATEQPALGLPGGKAYGVLAAEHIIGIDRVYVVPHSDEAGTAFVAGVASRLWALGFRGKVWRVGLQDEAKDLSDLRCADAEGFADALIELVQRAEEVRPPALPLSATAAHPVPPAHLTWRFPAPVPISQLTSTEKLAEWLWKGFLRRGEITLMPALWKSGKTTLMAHLLKAFEVGGTFLGLPVLPAKVLYITEESGQRWTKRRDCLRLRDHIHVQIRPFAAKPRLEDWEAFLLETGRRVIEDEYDVVFFDTLASLWPVRDENDASAVQAALMPLHDMIGERAALHMNHHTRKSDGQEATASRGSGALTGFVDTIVELRRFAPQDRQDRRRVLSGYGRDDDTSEEMVIELTEAGYVAHGDRPTLVRRDIGGIVPTILPRAAPGIAVDDILEHWPNDKTPRRQGLVDALREGAETGRWVREGTGKRGSPFTFWIDENAPRKSPFD